MGIYNKNSARSKSSQSKLLPSWIPHSSSAFSAVGDNNDNTKTPIFIDKGKQSNQILVIEATAYWTI